MNKHKGLLIIIQDYFIKHEQKHFPLTIYKKTKIC